LVILGSGALFLMASSAQEPSLAAEAVKVETHTFRPERRETTDERIRQLRLPDGFQINVFAKDLGNPRMMTVAQDGTVYVARRDQGEVSALRDRDGDGRAEDVRTVVRNLPGVHDLLIHQDHLYMVTIRELFKAPLDSNGNVGEREKLIDDLPDGGQHPNRTIKFGPDGMLYITLGSTCNNCREPNPEHATMLRAQADGQERRIFAKGLRNTLGFAWHPETGELWGMDHGSDMRGDDIPVEELNRIVEGGDYGWPFCHGQKLVDGLAPDPKEGTKEEYCAQTIAPSLEYTAHSAPMGLVFYTSDQFPPQYRGDAFVAMRGSWNRLPPSGYKVVRIRFEGGRPVRIEEFVTGFLIEEGRAHFARLCGVALAGDGALLVSDDSNGYIYRILYRGGAR
jgi:glucose/arabinose dehydrogenase